MMLGHPLVIGLLVLMAMGAQAMDHPSIPREELDPNHWREMAKESIEHNLKIKPNNHVAKNVILFIGDGMGPTTVTAARIYKGQKMGMPGEETKLEFDKFPNVALSKTYNVDRQTPDSAGTATAILSGVKTNYYVVGVDPRVTAGDCASAQGTDLKTVLDWAKEAGKRTGVVVTARVTHATPAALYAKSAYRWWEGDVDTVNVTGGCKDIAQQLIDRHEDLNVVLGGGRRYFLPNTTPDPEYNNFDEKQRLDGRDLIQEWQARKSGTMHSYVWNKQQFDQVNAHYTDYLLGLFEPNHMQYELERDTSAEPSLAEMTEKAIDVLNKDDMGFFLLVEGSRIDHGHHDNLAKKAITETLSMEQAIKVAMEKTDEEETLIIVTADHSVPFDITGYQYRGTDIFGLVDPIDPTENTTDGKPYSVLYYANGPGHHSPRQNLNNVDMKDKDFAYPAGVPMPWASHGGEDVGIYAKGPMSHLVRGVQEQNYIAYVMAKSACIGPYAGYECYKRREHQYPCNRTMNGSDVTASHNLLLLLLSALITMAFLKMP